MPMRISEEKLIAYVDGELDDVSAAEVDAALAADPRLRDTTRQLRETSVLLRSAFNAPMLEPAPARFVAALDGVLAELGPRAGRVARERDRHLLRPALALAASLVMLAIGLGGGYIAAGWRLDNEQALVDLARRSDEVAMREALASALENNVSGTSVSWDNPISGRSGEVTPVRTFRDDKGLFCREYRESIGLAGAVENLGGVACRQSSGSWRTVAITIDK